MANNPYLTPKTKFKDEDITQETKNAWDRFYSIHQRMKRWTRQEQAEKVQSNMWKWEKFSQQAWAYGWEVPDHFDAYKRLKFKHRRNTR